MNKCSRYEDYINLYIDNELDEAARKEFEEHLASCSKCREEVSQMQEVIRLCGILPQEELPENFKQELHNKLLDMENVKRKSSKLALVKNNYLKICSSLAAGFLIIFALKGLWSGSYLNTTGMSAKSDRNLSASQSVMDIAKPAADSEEKIGSSESKNNAALQNDGGQKAEKAMASQPEVFSGKAAQKREAPVPAQGEAFSAADASKNNTQADIKPQINADVGTSANPAVKSMEAAGFAAASQPSADGIVRSEANINIFTDNSGTALEKIKTIAANYGAELVATGNTKAPADRQSKMSILAESAKSPEQNEETVINIKISSFQYQKFQEDLKMSSGTAAIEFGNVSVQDQMNILSELVRKLEDTGSKIDALEKNGTQQEEELSRLKSERTAIQTDIANIKSGSAYIFVTINIKKK